jgi:hypothetical protein
MKASLFLAALDATLPPERLTHGRVERSRETVADSAGRIGRPYVAEGLLGMLERRGQIGRAQRLAGEQFAEWFRLAQLDPLRAADIGQRIPSGRSATGLAIEHARRRVNAALDACGGISSPCGCAAWYVLGLELTVAEFARREGWSGRAMRHETAKHLLFGALSVLAAHYGKDR